MCSSASQPAAAHTEHKSVAAIFERFVPFFCSALQRTKTRSTMSSGSSGTSKKKLIAVGVSRVAVKKSHHTRCSRTLSFLELIACMHLSVGCVCLIFDLQAAAAVGAYFVGRAIYRRTGRRKSKLPRFGKFKYPVTRRCEHVDTWYGEKVPDPYKWLESQYCSSSSNSCFLTHTSTAIFAHLFTSAGLY
jgi:hypothetical protein